MSTNDAGELEELSVVGGETTTPLYSTAQAAATQTARKESHETTTWQHSHQLTKRQEETHKALICEQRKEDAVQCGDSKIQNQQHIRPRLTSSIFVKLSSNACLDNPQSLTEPQRPETENSSCRGLDRNVNGQTSPPDIFIDVASDSPLPEKTPFPAKKEEDFITVVFNGLETTRDLSITPSLSNSDFELLEHNGLCTPLCASQPRRTGSGSFELDIKDYTRLENQTDFEELSDRNVNMLSSTVVTVLAPQWSGRLRRTKRFEGTGNLEAHGSLQDVTNIESNRPRECFQGTQNQHGVERMFTDGSHAQLRVPFLGTRSNTVGWSSKSGPVSLDYESKRKMVHSASLDVNSGRMINRRTDAGALSPVATTASSVSPHSLHPSEQKRSLQTGHQGGLSSLSSKPTTSSLLLSLRRFNSNSRSSNPNPTVSGISPAPLSNDRDGKQFTTHLSQTFLNNNEQDRVKPLHSTSSMSYRRTETGHIFSPSSSNYKERDASKTCFLSSSTINKVTEETPYAQQHPTIIKTQSSLSCSKQAFPSRGPSERHQSLRGSDKSTNIFTEASMSSSRHSPYDSSALLNSRSIPRTTLTSTSWWKQVTPEGSTPLTLNDTTNIKNKPNTILVPPCNDNSDFAYQSPNDNHICSSQMPNNRENNNTTESVCKGNMNLVMKTQGGTHHLKQRNTEDSRDHESDRLVKQQHGFNLNRELQKPHSFPDFSSSTKINRATMQTTVIHSKDLSKHDVSNSSFTAHVTELPPTLLNLKSSNTPTESSIKYKNNHCPLKTNNNPVSSHNRDSQMFTKQSLSLETTDVLNSETIKSKFVYGLPLTQNTRTSPSFQSHPIPVCSQTNKQNASSYNISSSQTPKFQTATTSPLGFERNYASIPKPFHSKTASSSIPTVDTISKTNYSRVSTSSRPEATTAPNPSLLTPPINPATSSPTTITISPLLTPPATPVTTSPIYSETSNLKEGRTISSSLESDPKKHSPRAEGKRVRRVTWEDSVDQQHSEPVSLEKPDPSPTRSLSPRSIRAPSIFSFLRSSSSSTSTSQLCNPTPKTSNIEVRRGEKYRSLSSDSDLTSRERERTKQRSNDTMTFDQGRRESAASRKERTQSVESGTAQCRFPAPLALPPDFSTGYLLRYSSPPYSTLKSTRSTQGETKNITPRSPLFQQPSQSNNTPHPLLRTDPVADMTIPLSELTPSPINSPQPLSLSLPQSKIAMQGSSVCGVSQRGQVNNNHSKNISQDHQNGQILLVDNRVHISSKSLQDDEAYNSTCVTETLVYSIKSKVDTAAQKNTGPVSLQHNVNTPMSVETKLSQQSHTPQSKGAAGEPCSHSSQSSSGSSSTDSQSLDDERCNRRMKESKSRFFSVESNNEQSPKRSRFVLKKSISTPNSSLSRSDSERANKTNKRMDQVLNKLRQTFSTKRSDDDALFPWKWKRGSQTPPVSGMKDISNSDKTLEELEQEREELLQNNEKGTEENRWTQNRYTPIPSVAIGNIMAEDEFSIWSDKLTPETDQEDQNAYAEHTSENKTQAHLTIHSPTTHQFDLNTYDKTDHQQQTSNQFLSCRDPSPGRSSNPSDGHSAQFRKSTSSPRSPFSPFTSLSPLSPFSSPEPVTDDSVFYSPKLQHRRESSSPREPGEGISLGGSRRSRASTGPPSVGPGPDKEHLSSSYADLKYGIEPGRSFSVSSVLSSRPSGTGRISTGSRFMSVGDLSESALACGGTGKDFYHGFSTPDWTEYDCGPTSDCHMPYFSSNPGKMRSRSLPRSLTRRLANWSSEASAAPPVSTTTSKLAPLAWSPNMNTCHFVWDTDCPPTPPPTPPLSPVSRRISKPSNSSPPLPLLSSPGPPQESQSSRGCLPSRGYISSLTTFEESSDSGSDTTTDDEYYLETGEDDEKETEL
ncbi:mucin-2 [Scomber scombrus]|uniref:mucin-2 n=1 Tax=Scomber scombrus TaxID=13677 RepID=UPI002DDAC385|nr:mucin-2 [Scomber scombrus]